MKLIIIAITYLIIANIYNYFLESNLNFTKMIQ